MTARPIAVLAVLVGAGLICAALRAQDSPSISTWDGVYTAAQADRGEALYRGHCEACHGLNLDGGIDAPPLSDSSFLAAWDTVPLDKLFIRISRDMADNYTGKLAPETNTAILAYILKYNGFPAGTSELPAAGEILRQIRFDASKPARK